MKKILALVLSVVLLASVNAYAMNTESFENDIPISEAVLANEIISGIRQKDNREPIIMLSEDGINFRKNLLGDRIKVRKNAKATSEVIMYGGIYIPTQKIDELEIKEGLTWVETFNRRSYSNYLAITITPEQVVHLWKVSTVDEEKIPNKNWKQDLEEVKEILGLSDQK